MLAEVNFTAVSTIDLVIFLLLLWGGYKGFLKGFLVELVLTVLFVVSVLAVFKLIQTGYSTGSERFGAFSKAAPFFTLLILYALISLGISLLGKIMKGMMPVVFEGFDKILGMLLGIFKYCLSFGILFKLLVAVGVFNQAEISKSTIFYPIIMSMFQKMLDIATILAPFIGEMVNELEKHLRNQGQ